MVLSKHVWLIPKLGLTLALFWLVFRHIDLAMLRDIVRGQNRSLLVLAVALGFAQLLFGALRWRCILVALAGNGGILSVGQALRIYYTSIFFNACLPGTVGGDVVRVWLTKAAHIPMALSIHAVVIDRILAFLALVLFILFTAPWLGVIVGFPFQDAVPAVGLIFAIGLVVLLNLNRLLVKAQQWLVRWRFIGWLAYFADSVRMMLSHILPSLLALTYATVAHLCYCLSVWVLAHSLGLELTIGQCVTLLPLVMLAAVLPISIGGWGVREAGMVGMLSLAGVPKAAALALSIQSGLVVVAVSLPAGLIWLAFRRKGA